MSRQRLVLAWPKLGFSRGQNMDIARIEDKKTTTGSSQGVPKPQNDDNVAPLFWVLSLNLAAAACCFLLLYSLFQPTINTNPGLAAY